MTSRTRFLSKLIGLYTVMVTIAMATHREATVDAVTGILHDSSMMLILGVVTLAVGLAMVLGHNLWSGGAFTVLVTVVGWMTLMKGLLFLLLSPDTETDLFLNTLHYEQLFYVYLGISFTLGAFLTYAGFSRVARSANVLEIGQQRAAHC
jgi:hypothetical protein